jgi:hypothetical protein
MIVHVPFHEISSVRLTITRSATADEGAAAIFRIFCAWFCARWQPALLNRT